MGVKYSNNAGTLLTAGILDSDTSFAVDDVSAFPAVGGDDYMYLTLVNLSDIEVIKVTSVSGTTLTVVRAQDGTLAAAFNLGDKCELRLCVAMLTDALAEVSLNSRLKWKTSCIVSTTANITLSGEQTIDGVLTSASRVLVKNQTSPDENGIYVSDASTWSRATDSDTWDELVGSGVIVEQGTVGEDKAYLCASDSGGVLETTSVTWTEFGAQGPTGAAGVGPLEVQVFS